MSKRKQSLGNWGENLAHDYLESKGYAILARNIRTPHGELDLVAYQPATIGTACGTVVFVEVRTRSSTTLGTPELSITAVKQDHIRRSAAFYLQTHPEQAQDTNWRIDVIAIRRLDRHTPAEILHFENAFA